MRFPKLWAREVQAARSWGAEVGLRPVRELQVGGEQGRLDLQRGVSIRARAKVDQGHERDGVKEGIVIG